MDQSSDSEAVPAIPPPALAATVTPPQLTTPLLGQSRATTIADIMASVHLVGLSIATLIASIQITSILVSGWICSFSGIIAGLYAIRIRRWRSFLTLMMTPVLAVALVVLESIIRLGPHRAAIPFSIVFLVHQTCSSLLLIRDQHSHRNGEENQRSGKFTIRTLLALMIIVAVFFSIFRLAVTTNNAICVGAALVLVVLNIAGIAYTTFRNRLKKEQPQAVANQG